MLNRERLRNNSSRMSESLSHRITPPPDTPPPRPQLARPLEVEIINAEEDRMHEMENINIGLMEENEKLRENMTLLIKSYPKEMILKKIINNKCPICLEMYKYDDIIGITNCIHVFHKKCIDESIEKNNLKCPKCRFDFMNSIFMYIKFNLEITGSEFFS